MAFRSSSDIAEEQAALRRVATLAARGAEPEEVFAAVAEEIGRLLDVDQAALARYDLDEAVSLGHWSRPNTHHPPGGKAKLGGRNVITTVFATGAPARIDDYADATGPIADIGHAWGSRSAVGIPVNIEGRLWGVMTLTSRRSALPADAETRVTGFTELIAAAIANAQARTELRGFANQQAALRQVATLVAEGAPPEEVFAAVTAEVGRVLEVDFASMSRYDSRGGLTIVGAWSASDASPTFPVGTRLPAGGANVHTQVFETHLAARFDSIVDDVGPALVPALKAGIRASVGVPINVEGRLWGVIITSSTDEPLPVHTEPRLEGFSALVASAIANAQARVELRDFAEEQAALGRVATLVARGVPPEEVFAAVTEEVGRAFAADFTGMSRYNGDGTATVAGQWTRTDGRSPMEIGERFDLGGANVTTQVSQTERPARVDNYGDASGVWADAARQWGFGSCVGVPIRVEGRLWGVVSVGYTRAEPLPPDAEVRLAGFSDLVATAIANAQFRVELRAYAEEQAALRRVATLVARDAPPERVFAAVTEEIGRVLAADYTAMSRYEPDRSVTVMGAWNSTGADLAVPIGGRVELGGRNTATQVFDTGRPARIDHSGDTTGVAAELARSFGSRSTVGVPISVEGRLWGVMNVFSTHDEPLPADTEARLTAFVELAATAIANADAQAALTESRARIVAATDATRRRVERDLHDGVQQRLVSLALQLRTAQAIVPPEAGELAAQLDRAVAAVNGAVDDVHEIALGIHPKVLGRGGLRTALNTLVARATVPVNIDIRVAARLPEQVELAAYYVVSEALTNAVKHSDASEVRINLAVDEGVVRVVVDDDGRGGATFDRGTGLVGLKDRVEAVGGRLSLLSPPGAGTTVSITLPLGDDSSLT